MSKLSAEDKRDYKEDSGYWLDGWKFSTPRWFLSKKDKKWIEKNFNFETFSKDCNYFVVRKDASLPICEYIGFTSWFKAIDFYNANITEYDLGFCNWEVINSESKEQIQFLLNRISGDYSYNEEIQETLEEELDYRGEQTEKDLVYMYSKIVVKDYESSGRANLNSMTLKDIESSLIYEASKAGQDCLIADWVEVFDSKGEDDCYDVVLNRLGNYILFKVMENIFVKGFSGK